MKNYKEKEKRLDNILQKLNTMTNKVTKMSNHINSLSLEKNQLLREKEESDKNYHDLLDQHQGLKSELEKINKDLTGTFGDKNNLNKKIDELNQETEILIDEIEKWQM